MLFTLHGFLGLPSDWQFLDRHFTCRHLDSAGLIPVKGFQEAAQCINAQAESHSGKRILLGYSLGGRLALHALLDSPSLWSAAVIISAHPGLQNPKEKKARRLNDIRWAHRFLQDPWEESIASWHSNPAFNGHCRERKEGDFSRKHLAEALIHWSLGNQENLSGAIQHLPMPVLWITGAKDRKFTALARKIVFSNPSSTHCIIEDAGHRVPWEKQDAFLKALAYNLNLIKNVHTKERHDYIPGNDPQIG